MVSRYEILRIIKSTQKLPHERVTHIGGIDDHGSTWMIGEAEVIRGIESGNLAFYVKQAGKILDVVVAMNSAGHKYIKTVADELIPNNLLSLPEVL
jgi:hypothetical protein